MSERLENWEKLYIILGSVLSLFYSSLKNYQELYRENKWIAMKDFIAGSLESLIMPSFVLLLSYLAIWVIIWMRLKSLETLRKKN
jgi:ABC-type dipeptide/oligopeptide/nickel transport system permease component